ncbi:right-handed parallel beta-helix repeat-containing protein [Chitinophaga defluvii]|uniref:Right-handed parallel beta-helix repeat-containing protein n=1 Tax=Chitinophaga defluvii TaxID=3163343 RepID=A0ABV2T0P1_9BACT
MRNLAAILFIFFNVSSTLATSYTLPSDKRNDSIRIVLKDASIPEIEKALADLKASGKFGVLEIVEGKYQLDDPIIIRQSNLKLILGNNCTFRLSEKAKSNNVRSLFVFIGEITPEIAEVTNRVSIGDKQLSVTNAKLFKKGDYIQIKSDELLSYARAYYNKVDIVRIDSVLDNKLYISPTSIEFNLETAEQSASRIFKGKVYKIKNTGSTDFTKFGAAGNTENLIFKATADSDPNSCGSGTIKQVSKIYINKLAFVENVSISGNGILDGELISGNISEKVKSITPLGNNTYRLKFAQPINKQVKSKSTLYIGNRTMADAAPKERGIVDTVLNEGRDIIVKNNNFQIKKGNIKFYQSAISGIVVQYGRNISIEGIKLMNFSDKFLMIDKCVNVNVQNVNFSANAFSEIGNYGCYFSESKDCIIKNCYVSTKSWAGIDGNLAINLRIENNIIDNSGISPHSGYNVLIKDNLLVNSSIFIRTIKTVAVGNSIFNQYNVNNFGIRLDESATIGPTTINNNYILFDVAPNDNQNAFGIYFSGGTTNLDKKTEKFIKRLTVDNNYIGNASIGISLFSSKTQNNVLSSDINISRNEFINCSKKSIWLNNSENPKIESNICFTNNKLRNLIFSVANNVGVVKAVDKSIIYQVKTGDKLDLKSPELQVAKCKEDIR